MKYIFRAIGEFIFRFFFECLYLILPRLSWQAMYFIADIFAMIFWAVWPKHRRITLKNLTLVFGKEKREPEITAIARKNYKNMMRSAFETIRAPFFSDTEINNRFLITGEEHLKNALAKGKGVVAYTGHWGSFSLVSYCLLRRGYDARYILRAPHNEQFKKFYTKVMTDAKGKFLWDDPGTVVKETMSMLKENAVMVIAGDQYSGSGTTLEFLGQPTLFTEGPLVLSLRSGAAIVPVFITRGPDNIHTISFGPEMKFTKDAGFRDKVRSALSELTHKLEECIRQDPSQWLWLHRRWKNLKEVIY